MPDNHIIESLAELEALYAAPKENSLKKEVSELNDVYRQWLEHARFFALASAGSTGLDCTPRGDAKGAAFIIKNNSTIISPDRRGNNRLDTLRNIVEDSRVALMFLIPGLNEALRINGEAIISTDPALLAKFDSQGKQPVSAIVVHIQAVYFQCARAIMRSQLWDGDNADAGSIPSAGEMIKSAVPEFDAQEYDAAAIEYVRGSLY